VAEAFFDVRRGSGHFFSVGASLGPFNNTPGNQAVLQVEFGQAAERIRLISRLV
jgi:hypothetical protein